MMSQAEIVAFLISRGVQPLGEWRPGQPLLYVVEDPFRTETSHYGEMAERLRPSVARIDNPDSVEPGERAVDKHGVWTRIFRIVNASGGQVDYYAIDPDSHAVTLVRTSASVRDAGYPYVAPENLLFQASDSLFPRG